MQFYILISVPRCRKAISNLFSFYMLASHFCPDWLCFVNFSAKSSCSLTSIDFLLSVLFSVLLLSISVTVLFTRRFLRYPTLSPISIPSQRYSESHPSMSDIIEKNAQVYFMILYSYPYEEIIFKVDQVVHAKSLCRILVTVLVSLYLRRSTIITTTTCVV